MIGVLPLIDDEVATEAMSLRARNRDRARTAIVESALELFAARGFDEVSVAEVAARAAVSPATVARYFPSKELILFSDREANVARLRADLLGRPRSESPMRALVGALVAQPPLSTEALRRLLRSRQAIARSAVLRGRAGEGLAAWRDGIADALAERGAITAIDARSLATAIVALLDDAAARWADGGGRADLGDEVRTSLECLERTRRRT